MSILTSRALRLASDSQVAYFSESKRILISFQLHWLISGGVLTSTSIKRLLKYLELLLLALALVALSLSVSVIFSLDFLTPDKVEIVRIRVHFQTVFSVISIFLNLLFCTVTRQYKYILEAYRVLVEHQRNRKLL